MNTFVVLLVVATLGASVYGADLLCASCSGFGSAVSKCASDDAPKVVCKEENGQLPGCVSISFVTAGTVTLIRSCIHFLPGQNYCQKIYSMYPPGTACRVTTS